jgi:hypothetical protein
MSWDTYFPNSLKNQIGVGLFEIIGDESSLPPPPIGSGYRRTTDSMTRVLTISMTSERVTTTF